MRDGHITSSLPNFSAVKWSYFSLVYFAVSVEHSCSSLTDSALRTLAALGTQRGGSVHLNNLVCLLPSAPASS